MEAARGQIKTEGRLRSLTANPAERLWLTSGRSLYEFSVLAHDEEPGKLRVFLGIEKSQPLNLVLSYALLGLTDSYSHVNWQTTRVFVSKLRAMDYLASL